VVAWEGSKWAVHGEPKAAAELEAAGAVEDEAWMRENEIARAGEHQWVTAVLEGLEIGVEQKWKWLATVDSGAAEVRWELKLGEREKAVEKKCDKGKQDHTVVLSVS
jgi:hypothetical protein